MFTSEVRSLPMRGAPILLEWREHTAIDLKGLPGTNSPAYFAFSKVLEKKFVNMAPIWAG
jgi:hypothetical protein